MPRLELHYDRLLSWLGPVAVAGFLAACGGGEKAPAGGADAPSGAPSTPPPAAETQGSADAPPATGAAQAPAKAPADSPPRSPAASAAPAAPAGEAAGGGGPNDPKSIALGDSIFHGQAGGGTCYACHGQDGKGSAVRLLKPVYTSAQGSYPNIAGVICRNTRYSIVAKRFGVTLLMSIIFE
jgi:hypothetical protein